MAYKSCFCLTTRCQHTVIPPISNTWHAPQPTHPFSVRSGIDPDLPCHLICERLIVFSEPLSCTNHGISYMMSGSNPFRRINRPTVSETANPSLLDVRTNTGNGQPLLKVEGMLLRKLQHCMPDKLQYLHRLVSLPQRSVYALLHRQCQYRLRRQLLMLLRLKRYDLLIYLDQHR